MTKNNSYTLDTVTSLPTINKDIFKAYDIRGEVGKDWCTQTNDDDASYRDAYLIGQALGSKIITLNSTVSGKQIIVGRDGRNSSQKISEYLIKGLLSVGCDVTDIGLVATPVTYFFLEYLGIANCAMVTGSHNPPSHNGIKMVTEYTPTSKDFNESLYDIIVEGGFSLSEKGEYITFENALTIYKNAIKKDISLARPLRIAVDAGNGATALFAEDVFTSLNCEVHPLFCELDGNFPNHSPDPTVPENLSSLIALVKEKNLDLGIAFDGDGDRMIAVDNEGTLLWPDRIMILLAQEVIKSNKNTRVVFDSKCTMLLPQAIRDAGGQAIMCPNGHSIMKREMLRLDAIMGGEFSGHIVLRDRWNDFDDAPYVAARFLEILANSDKSCCDMFKTIPNSYSSHEYKLKMHDIHQAADIAAKFIANAEFPGATLNMLDGLRVEYDDAWGIFRSSNTSPSLGLRFDATSETRLKEIKEEFRHVFKKIDFQQNLPF